MFGTELKDKISQMEASIYAHAGKEFNTIHPCSWAMSCLKTWGFLSAKDKRGYSTNAEVLEKIRDKHPIVPEILEYRNFTKLNSTYVEGMKPLISARRKDQSTFSADSYRYGQDKLYRTQPAEHPHQAGTWKDPEKSLYSR